MSSDAKCSPLVLYTGIILVGLGDQLWCQELNLSQLCEKKRRKKDPLYYSSGCKAIFDEKEIKIMMENHAFLHICICEKAVMVFITLEKILAETYNYNLHS